MSYRVEKTAAANEFAVIDEWDIVLSVVFGRQEAQVVADRLAAEDNARVQKGELKNSSTIKRKS